MSVGAPGIVILIFKSDIALCMSSTLCLVFSKVTNSKQTLGMMLGSAVYK